jgi:hypothetical protein
MKPKTYILITDTLLTVVTILHATRAVFHWPVQIGTWNLPMWMSIVGMLVTGTLASIGFSLARK